MDCDTLEKRLNYIYSGEFNYEKEINEATKRLAKAMKEIDFEVE